MDFYLLSFKFFNKTINLLGNDVKLTKKLQAYYKDYLPHPLYPDSLIFSISLPLSTHTYTIPLGFLFGPFESKLKIWYSNAPKHSGVSMYFPKKDTWLRGDYSASSLEQSKQHCYVLLRDPWISSHFYYFLLMITENISNLFKMNSTEAKIQVCIKYYNRTL